METSEQGAARPGAPADQPIFTQLIDVHPPCLLEVVVMSPKHAYQNRKARREFEEGDSHPLTSTDMAVLQSSLLKIAPN